MSDSGALSTRRWYAWVAFVVVVGIALRSHAVAVGFMGDDYVQFAMLEGLYAGERSPLDLYRFVGAGATEHVAHLQRGSLPWWTWSEFHGGAFRPLSSALLWVDHTLFGPDPKWAHVHALAWWALMVVSAARLLRSVTKDLDAWVAPLALAIFAMDDGVTMNIAWVANRCALVAATFAFATVRAHIEARAHGSNAGGWKCNLLFALALAAGEYGVVAWGYLLCFEWFRPGRSSKVMARALAGPTVIAAAFALFYVVGDYGSHGGQALYANPVSTPAAYVGHLAHRFPRAIAELFISMPAASGDLAQRPYFAWLGLPGLDALQWMPGLPSPPAQPETLFGVHAAAAALCTAAAFGVAVIVARGRRVPSVVKTFALAAVLGLLPVLVAPAHGRLFTLSTLGAALALAWLATLAFRRMRDSAEGHVTRALSAGLVAFIAWTHLLADPAWSRIYLARFGDVYGEVDGTVLRARDGSTRRPLEFAGQDVVVFAAPRQSIALHGAFMVAAHTGRPPASWHTLSMSSVRLLVQRTRTDEITVSPIEGAWLSTTAELTFRPADIGFEPGQSFDLGVAKAQVVRLDDAGRPAMLRVRFVDDLEAKRFVFVVQRDVLERIDLPPVGKSMIIAPPKAN